MSTPADVSHRRRRDLGAVPAALALLRRTFVPSVAAFVLAASNGRALAAQVAMPARPSADTIEGASGVGVSDTTYHRVTLSEYLTRVAGPRAILRDVALSGFDQAIGRPKEWPKNWRGYGDRVSSRAASQAISQTILLGLSASLDQRRAEFTLCGCTDRSDRAVHAMLTPLRVGTSGGTRLSPLVPVSEISGAILVTSVHPGGLSVRDGLLGGVTGLAGSSLVALGREFWPWKRRPPGV